LLPAGSAYLAHVRHQVHNLSFDEIDKHAEEERLRLEALNGNGVNGEDDLGVGDEEESETLLMLDPKEWKVSPIYHSPRFFLTKKYLTIELRNKTTMRSWGSHICVIKPLQIKSKSLVSLSSIIHITSV
jgi:hypothetical protein